jgi:hypothetical protein
VRFFSDPLVWLMILAALVSGGLLAWPAYELDRQKDGTWTRTALDPPEVTAALSP